MNRIEKSIQYLGEAINDLRYLRNDYLRNDLRYIKSQFPDSENSEYNIEKLILKIKMNIVKAELELEKI